MTASYLGRVTNASISGTPVEWLRPMLTNVKQSTSKHMKTPAKFIAYFAGMLALALPGCGLRREAVSPAGGGNPYPEKEWPFKPGEATVGVVNEKIVEAGA